MTPDELSRERTLGGIYAFCAYLLWGVLPIYFVWILPTGPWELVGWRILFSLVFCALLLAVTRGWRAVLAVLRDKTLVWWTVLAAILIYINWQTFILGALSGHVIETSLGYFINPIVTVLLGVLVLHERLRITQWIALALALVAVIVIIVGYRSVPWISLILAASFGTYGLVKKRLGPRVGAVTSLTLETLWLAPIAVVQVIVVALTTGLTLGAVSTLHTVLLACTGVVTAVPLLLFGAGARRIPLSVVGLLQFVAPILQFITGAWILQEPMPLERWIGFAIVWLALAVLTADSLHAARKAHAVAPLP